MIRFWINQRVSYRPIHFVLSDGSVKLSDVTWFLCEYNFPKGVKIGREFLSKGFKI